MLNDETRRKLRVLNIGEFIEELEIQQQDPQTLALPFDDRFQLLTDGVYHRKYNDKVRRLIKNAKFRLPKADIHDILYIDKRPLNRGIIADLASCRFVDDCRSIVFQGYPSSGKTFLGCAMAKEACRNQHKTRYIRLPDLLEEYAEKSVLPGGKNKVLNKYAAFKVLVLDEWLMPELSKADVEFLLELTERRFDSTSTIFCTLYKREDWVKRPSRRNLCRIYRGALRTQHHLGGNRRRKHAAVLIPCLTAWVELRPDFAKRRFPCAERASAHGLIARNNHIYHSVRLI